jgi:NAD-dependent SIR2 family protein deacetylase
MSSLNSGNLENNEDKWSFIEDPEKIAYREKADNCASTVTNNLKSALWSLDTQQVNGVFQNRGFTSSIWGSYRSNLDPATGQLKSSGMIFEAHPNYDKVKCAECFDTKVFTRCFYNPKTLRSFYFCFSCSQDFEKQGYILLE